MQTLLTAAAGIEEYLIKFRRDLHQNPELSLEEKETSAKVAAQLRQFGLDVRTRTGGYGVVADLHGGQPGRMIALRADMDALPITEETNLPFKSRKPGVMHACGHDAHTAMLLGAAKLLCERQEQVQGTIRFIFQSAEEVNDGAKLMIEAGGIEGVEEIYGLHNLPTLPAGQFAVRHGALMGSVGRFEIDVCGKGGHGAQPDQSIDPIVAASAIVMGLQTAVSREISPFEPAVVTIGSFHAGNANNVIPERAKLTGTIRAFSENVKAEMAPKLRRIITDIARAHRCSASMTYYEQVPVLYNTDRCVDDVTAVAERMLGKDHCVEAAPTLAGEDFAMYLEHVPGCFFWLGSGPEKDAEKACGLHHPQFQINEDCLKYGAALLAGVAMERGRL